MPTYFSITISLKIHLQVHTYCIKQMCIQDPFFTQVHTQHVDVLLPNPINQNQGGRQGCPCKQPVQHWLHHFFDMCVKFLTDWNFILDLCTKKKFAQNCSRKPIQICYISSEGGTGENWSDVTPLNLWIVLIYLAKNL